jgi:hypothetical protein
MFVFSLLKKKKPLKITGRCMACGKCCQSIILFHRGSPVKSPAQFEKLVKKKPFYRSLSMVSQNARTGVLYFSCEHLGADNRCRIYENRPDICRNYPASRMFSDGGNLLPGCGFKALPPGKSFADTLRREIERS